MEKRSILDKIIIKINKNANSKHIIIINKDFSKKFIKSVFENNNITDIKIYYLDEYIFLINNKNINNIIKKDLAYMEFMLSEANSVFDNYNITEESENIIDVLNKFFLQNDICIKSDSNEKDIIKKFEYKLLSYESKIFFEIIKIWISRSVNEGTYINKYISLLKRKAIVNKSSVHHVINFKDHCLIEKNWLENHLQGINKYENSYDKDIYNNNFAPENLESYNSYDFLNHEDELEYITNDISKAYQTNKNIKIALINNDRYFARRLRAILDRENIKINDSNGWLLSTSACCTYINSILNYFFIIDNYVNIYDIVMSPFFKPNESDEKKFSFMNRILKFQKNNIEVSLREYWEIKNHYNEEFSEKINIKNTCTFKEFRNFIIKKLNDFDSKNLIKDDCAGKEFLNILDYISNINSTQEKNLIDWHKILINYLETKTFTNLSSSNLYYTDIRHASLYSFDKIYISSMSNKNYPKKKINNFSKKNILYSDYEIKSNIEEKDNIKDFLSLSRNSKSLLLSFHKSNNDDIFSKSKYKIYIDHFLENKNKLKNINSEFKKTENKSLELKLNEKFNNLTYRDIENYNSCFYCFYHYKNSPNKNKAIINNDKIIFGNYVHSILFDLIHNKTNINNINEIINNLKLISNSRKKDYFLKNNYPYEIKLWKKMIPKIAEFFAGTEHKKYNISAEKKLLLECSNKISLHGRYDLKYSLADKIFITDYKTSTYIPSRTAVISGESLQLPFYSILDPSINIMEYLLINVSKNELKNISFNVNEFGKSREMIFETIEDIYMLISNKKSIVVEESDLGCEICGFQTIK